MTAQEFRPQIKIGDFVSLNKWDETERCKIGSPAQVIKIEADKCSETGIMLTLQRRISEYCIGLILLILIGCIALVMFLTLFVMFIIISPFLLSYWLLNLFKI